MMQPLVHAPHMVRSQTRGHRFDRFALAGQKQPGAVELQWIDAVRVSCSDRQPVETALKALLTGA